MLQLNFPDLNNAFGRLIIALERKYETKDLSTLDMADKYEAAFDFIRAGGHNLRGATEMLSMVLGVSKVTGHKMVNLAYDRVSKISSDKG